MSTRPDASDRVQSNRVFNVLVILLGAWLCFPALTSVHVEGFSASLQSIAILLHTHGRAGLQLADQQYPVVTEYLYMTRSGLIDLLQAFMAATGATSDAIFRSLILISYVVYFLACVRIARTWSSESRAFVSLAFLLTPGLVEIGFYFADNLTSAMFAVLGLALIQRHRATPAWAWCGAGACLALATLIRVDAILTAPAFALGLLLSRRPLTQLVRNVAVFAAGGVVVVLLAQLLTPFQLSDSLQISHLFQNLHERVEQQRLLLEITWGFFGPITGVLLLLGLVRNVRTRPWQWHIGLTILPFLFYLYVLPHALEIRMFLLLGGPAVLIHAATGLNVVRDLWRSQLRYKRVLAAGVSLFCCAVFFSPIARIAFHDGPRALLGRFWSPLVWREWQKSTESGLAQLDALTDSVQPHQTLLAISGHYDADHYLRLRLLQHGFDIIPSATDKDCGQQVEVFRNGDRTVIHLRSEVPYAIADYPPAYLQARQIVAELPCAEAFHFTRAEFVSWMNTPEFFVPALDPVHLPEWSVRIPWGWVPAHSHFMLGEMYLQPLTSDQITRLDAATQRTVAESLAHVSGWEPIERYDQIHSIYRWRFGSLATPN